MSTRMSHKLSDSTRASQRTQQTVNSKNVTWDGSPNTKSIRMRLFKDTPMPKAFNLFFSLMQTTKMTLLSLLTRIQMKPGNNLLKLPVKSLIHFSIHQKKDTILHPLKKKLLPFHLLLHQKHRQLQAPLIQKSNILLLIQRQLVEQRI